MCDFCCSTKWPNCIQSFKRVGTKRGVGKGWKSSKTNHSQPRQALNLRTRCLLARVTVDSTPTKSTTYESTSVAYYLCFFCSIISNRILKQLHFVFLVKFLQCFDILRRKLRFCLRSTPGMHILTVEHFSV